MLLDALGDFFYRFLITLNIMVYKLVNYSYEIFLFLATDNFFDSSIYNELVDRIYIVLGVVILFVLAYNVLLMVVDPDVKKSGKAAGDIIKNLIITFIIIAVVPTIFEFAFSFQTSILTNGTIQNLFLASNSENQYSEVYVENGEVMAGSLSAGGRDMMTTALFSFIGGNKQIHNRTKFAVKDKGNYSIDCETKGESSDCTVAKAEEFARNTGNITPLYAFTANFTANPDAPYYLDFDWFLALIAGGYLVYCIISFCFDLAVRIVKLAFFEITAPLCVASRIIPKQKDIYQKWLKNVINTYVAVFIRVGIMVLGIFFMREFTKSLEVSMHATTTKSVAYGVETFGKVFLILGIVTFIKQAPKLIEEIFGITDVKFGIKDKLKEGIDPIKNVAGGAIFGAAGGIGGIIAGKGNPLAGIRAAKAGVKNHNLSGIESEIKRREAWNEKKQKGATTIDLLNAYSRQKLGLATPEEASERKIRNDRSMNYIDGAGNKHAFTYGYDEKTGKYGIMETIRGKNGETKRMVKSMNDEELLARGFLGKNKKIYDALNPQNEITGSNLSVEYTNDFAQFLEKQKASEEAQIKMIDEENEKYKTIQTINKQGSDSYSKAKARALDKAKESDNLKGTIKYTIPGIYDDSEIQTAMDKNDRGALENILRNEGFNPYFFNRLSLEDIKNYINTEHTKTVEFTGNIDTLEHQYNELLKDTSLSPEVRDQIVKSYKDAKDDIMFEYFNKKVDIVRDVDGVKVNMDSKYIEENQLDGNLSGHFNQMLNAYFREDFKDENGKAIRITDKKGLSIEDEKCNIAEFFKALSDRIGGIDSALSAKIDNFQSEKTQHQRIINEVEAVNNAFETKKSTLERSDEHTVAKLSSEQAKDHPDILGGNNKK